MGDPIRCTFADCRTVAVHHDALDLCLDHRNHVALAMLPIVYRKWPTTKWFEASKEFEAAFGPINRDVRPNPPRWVQGDTRPRNHNPVVYFVTAGDRVKIGTTVNVKARMASLSLPGDAEVVHTVPGDVSIERQYHRRFAEQRIGTSEWFYIAGDLADFLAEHA